MIAGILLGLAFYIPFIGTKTLYQKTEIVVEETTEEVLPVSTIPEVPAILKKIGECESGNRQFYDDGTVVRGNINPLDLGKYQINLGYHEESAKRLGYDLYTEEGNTKYALHLYNTAGTSPWNWSKHCWGK